jgi:hypothetical protein
MSARTVDDFSTAWTPDASGLWSTTSTEAADYLRAGGRGMEIVAVPGAGAAPQPFAERRFAPALDLRGDDELRLWLKGSRVGDGRANAPVYLAFEADTDPAAAGGPWQRLLPVAQAGRWEPHALWLADMPAALRAATAVLRVRSLAPQLGFTVAVDELVATRPQPITDGEAALRGRIDGAHSVTVAGAAKAVPAIIELLEKPPQRQAPYVLLRQRRVLPLPRAANALVVDNHTPAGAYTRPAPAHVQLDYEVDVFVDEGVHRTQLLEEIAGGFAREPRLIVDGRPVELRTIDVEILAGQVRAPLFYRLEVPVETGARQFSERAAPFLLVGAQDRSGVEEVRV